MSALESVRSGYVVFGVDTHEHVNVAAVRDIVGGILATLTIPTDTGGFKKLDAWAGGFGKVIAFGIEGAGSYGATGTRSLKRDVLTGELDGRTGSPKRSMRRVRPAPFSQGSPP